MVVKLSFCILGHTGVLQLYISDCGSKVLLLSGFRQVFLWETQRVNRTINTGMYIGPNPLLGPEITLVIKIIMQSKLP